MATEPKTVRDPHSDERPVGAKVVLLSILAMVVVGLLVHFTVAGLFTAFLQHYQAQDTKPTAIMAGQSKKLPPEPRLQANEVGDMHTLRQSEDEILQNYGWVDRNEGVVRIPVERAMELLAERGLPSVTRSTQPVPATKAGGDKPAVPATKAQPESKPAGR